MTTWTVQIYVFPNVTELNMEMGTAQKVFDDTLYS